MKWKRSGWKILDAEREFVVAKSYPWDESGCREEDHRVVNLLANAPEMEEMIIRLVECIESQSYSLEEPEDFEAQIRRNRLIIDEAEGVIKKVRGEQ